MADTAYPVKRIRLINFHNFVDETIELEDGGHLFLLGDNGCGKTTILDAVHYVITAGKTMEWNSAARLAGSKRDGRRVQGIVLRYNIDTGIMNRGGAITYVALEIVGRHGRPLSIGMGLSATALDEQVGFWGFIRECPLEELPFTTEDGEHIRPSSRQEFKQRLDSGHGFYSNRAAYRKDLGDRLFGGEDSYLDICRFLSMGKSYREISAGAGDYHQLFKSLLPEPRTSLFEQIIESLRSLDESQSILDDLERKLGWLASLQQKLTRIGESREDILRYEWLLYHFTLLQKEGDENQCSQRIQQKQKKIAENQEALTVFENEQRELDERLQNLQAKDASGLVRQEKGCRDDFERKSNQLQDAEAKSCDTAREAEKSRKERDRSEQALKKMLTAFLPELARLATSLPFSMTAYQTEIDGLSRMDSMADIAEPASQEIINSCDLHIQAAIRQSTILEQKTAEYDHEIARKREKIEHLEKRSSTLPQVEGFESFEKALKNAMLTPMPLFQGLEWAPSVKSQERNYIEECIGEDILAAMVLRKAEYEQARSLCTGHPGLRICCEDQDQSMEIPDWMRRVFDIRESDPACLLTLGAEMESNGYQPSVQLVDGQPVLAFRGHERRLAGTSARLIGSDSRKKALADEIRRLNRELKQLGREQKALDQELDKVKQAQEAVENFKQYIHKKSEEIRTAIGSLQDAERNLSSIRVILDSQQAARQELQREVTVLEVRLKELGELIAKEGLANLEKRIKTLKNKLAGNRQRCNELRDVIGGDGREIKQLEQAIENNHKERALLAERKQTAEQQLLSLLPPGTDPAHYVLKTRKGQQFRSREAIAKESENCRIALATSINDLKSRLNDPEFGGGFRFTYDEERNELYDYRSQASSAIIIQQTTALDEQKEVINDQTRNLFKKIIMTDLMQYLRGHVGEMENMVRKINSLLRARSFGGQQYSFKIRPLDEYKRLINIIKKISPFDPAGEEELEAFFADHRDTIIATETGTVPDELDYRNWYRYEMVVSTLGEEGNVIDRRNKSLGSGGEQAVPNYLLILTIAHFMYRGKKVRLHILLFDEAFYGIDAGRRDQILGFASDLELQLFIASPDQDGVRQEVRNSTTLLVKKDSNYDVHLYPFHWKNPANRQISLLEPEADSTEIAFGEEL